MSQRIIGIDIGTYSIKVVRLERRMQELELLDFIEQPLNLQSRLSHEEQMAAVLEQIFANHILTADVISLSLPGHLLSSRILEIPLTNTKKLAQVIGFELEGFIPFSLDDLFFDYHILSQTPQQTTTLCVYMQDQKLGQYIDNLSRMHIDAKYLGADFADLAAMAMVSIVPAEDWYVLCDIGHSKTNVVIMKGDQLKYVRTIGIGGHHFTRAIQRSFNLNYEKAESLKLSRGKLFIRDDESDQVARILSRVARELASHIKQTLMGAATQYGSFSLPAIYCCGGGSKLVGILDYLSFYLRTNVMELDCLNFIHHKLEDMDDVAKVIPQSLSAALRPIYSTRLCRINFRKGPYAYKQDLQVLTTELKSVGVLFAAVLLLGLIHFFYTGHYYSRKIASVDKQIETIMSQDFSDIDFKKIKTDFKKRQDSGKASKDGLVAEYLKAIKSKFSTLEQQMPEGDGQKKLVMAVMQILSDTLPPKNTLPLEISEFEFVVDKDHVKLNASTDDPPNVDKVVAALNGSDYFDNVVSTDPKTKPNQAQPTLVWNFDLTMDLK
jgi:type IV pilus assembly protein PilM